MAVEVITIGMKQYTQVETKGTSSKQSQKSCDKRNII